MDVADQLPVLAAFIERMSYGLAVRWLHELQATPVTVVGKATRELDAHRRFAIVGLEAKIAGRPVAAALSHRLQRRAAQQLADAMSEWRALPVEILPELHVRPRRYRA